MWSFALCHITILYDKVPETKKLFWFETVLEAFGSFTVFAYLSFQCQNGAK
jgi:hypothetical protein